MPHRIVSYYREPPHNPKKQVTSLSIDLFELSLAAAKETLATGMHANSWLNLFLDALTPGNDLRWQDNGMGYGRELKRSFSNILGRFLARHYLETKENVIELIPIEGDGMTLHHLVLERKTSRGDLPDWIGCSNSELIVAEAKGSHDPSDWAKKAKRRAKKPQVLEGAKNQISRVVIRNAARKRSKAIAFKGWSVGSRWATVNNDLNPWLMAIDPKHGDLPLPPDEFGEVRKAIILRANMLMLRNLGFLETPVGEGADLPVEQLLSSERVFGINAGDEEVVEPGLHAIAGPFGFVPIQSRRDFRFIRFAQRLPSRTAIISLSKARVLGDISSTETSRRGNLSIERGGVSLTTVDPKVPLSIGN